MMKRITLLIDALINLILGILLVCFNPVIYNFLGVPGSDTNFYPNILGGVFIGITLALIIEAFRKKDNELIGLGLIGAICINICGGLVLTFWLIFGNINIPVHGKIFLWSLASILLIISSVELFLNVKMARHSD